MTLCSQSRSQTITNSTWLNFGFVQGAAVCRGGWPYAVGPSSLDAAPNASPFLPMSPTHQTSVQDADVVSTATDTVPRQSGAQLER